MNQSPNDEAAHSNENLPKPKSTDSFLLDIPVFTPSNSSIQKQKPSESLESSEPSSWSPSTDDGPPKYEYEFTNLWDGCLYSVYLYDLTDVSACERVVNRVVTPEEITYSPTGNGFIVDNEFKYTFTKNPYRRTFANPPQPSHEANLRRRTSIKVRTADDVLASI